MKLVDANVLLYAVNGDARQHRTARRWLDDALTTGAEPIAFSWLVLLAFVRISTHPSIFGRPLTAGEAFDIVEQWLTQDAAIVLDPVGTHLAVMRGLVEQTGTAGNLVNDAHLAAIAVEHSAEIATFDADFSRFEGVRVVHPS